MFGFRSSLVGSAADDISGEKWFNVANLPPEALDRVKAGQALRFSKELAGRVVLIEFWDYSCSHCIRTLPYLKKWWKKFGGDDFLIVGVHTPEYEYAKDFAKVESAVLRNALNYPVVSDPAYDTWKRYHAKAWPRILVVDQEGVVQYDHYGEGDYEAIEKTIQTLLN